MEIKYCKVLNDDNSKCKYQGNYIAVIASKNSKPKELRVCISHLNNYLDKIYIVIDFRLSNWQLCRKCLKMFNLALNKNECKKCKIKDKIKYRVVRKK